MARFVPVTHPAQHGGIAHLERASRSFGTVTAAGAVLFLLAGVGALAFRGASRVQHGLADWAEARREREEDRKLWELALTDTRVMADLVALNQQTPRRASGFF